MSKVLSPFELKDELIAIANKEHKGEILNAGRGNPNFLAINPRKVFNLIGDFAIKEAEYSYSFLNSSLGGSIRTEGLTTRFLSFLSNHTDKETAKIALTYSSYMEDQMGLSLKDVLLEMLNAYLASNYPVPPRSLVNAEKIFKKYIVKEMCNGYLNEEFDVFPTEGGTAAMAYIFNSIKSNKLMKPKDKIAIITPVFTPYLEIPGLPEFDYEIVELKLAPELHWQLPQSELDKLKDPAIKMLCMVNPSNPSSTKVNNETLQALKTLVTTERQDLMIVTDDVYGTFADEFTSLFSILPYNTILVYSYSKYFGATGWRLGTISVAKENVFDDTIKKMDTEVKKAIENRYSIMTPNPEDLKFIDRMVADSRVVALNHTAGLALPCQLQMALFSLHCLVDLSGIYKNACKKLIRSRYQLLYSSLGVEDIYVDENVVDYYTLLNIKDLSQKLFGNEFAEWFEENNKITDFMFALAKKTGVVLMPGSGFGDTSPTLRVSLANLQEHQYEAIGKATRKTLTECYESFKNTK